MEQPPETPYNNNYFVQGNQGDMQVQDEYGGYAIPRQDQANQPLLDKHLDASEIIDKLKNLLLGKEYNIVKDEWVDVIVEVVDSKTGNVKLVKQGPLIEPKKINAITNYIVMLLNSNTYLSKLGEEEINNTMWDIEKELMPLFFRLMRAKRIDSDFMRLLWGMIDKPIYFGLKRASESSGGGMTINAATKSYHSIEHISPGQNQQAQQKPKDFKMFGW